VWDSLGSGLVSSKAPWIKNRVYYARTPGQAAGWLPYVTQRDRRSLEHLNFSESGVFAVFFKGPGTGPVTSLTLNSVDYAKHGLAAEIRANVCNDTIQLPGISPACVAYRDNTNPWGRYVLVTIRKRSLYEQIERVYAYQVAPPLDCSMEPLPSVCVIPAPPGAPSLADGNPPPPSAPTRSAPLPQANWKLLAGFGTWRPEKRNRIFYARVPAQTNAWKLHLYETEDTRRALRQNFSRYGLLAIFLESWQPGSTIEGVYLAGDGALSVQIRGAPPPEPPYCPPPGPPDAPDGACVVSVMAPTPQYRLIAIRKDSLLAPVRRLYITEVPYIP
jgi:hypothetical protein